jgi:hypothetical protein
MYAKRLPWSTADRWYDINGRKCWDALCDGMELGRWYTAREMAIIWRDVPNHDQSIREVRYAWRRVMEQDAHRDDMERKGYLYRFTRAQSRPEPSPPRTTPECEGSAAGHAGVLDFPQDRQNGPGEPLGFLDCDRATLGRRHGAIAWIA